MLKLIGHVFRNAQVRQHLLLARILQVCVSLIVQVALSMEMKLISIGDVWLNARVSQGDMPIQ